MSILGQLTVTEVVNVYNLFAKQNGTATVKKFRDKQTGHQRLQDITRNKDRRVVVAALKHCNIKPEIIKLLPDVPVAVATPLKIIDNNQPVLPKKVDAAKVLSEANAKEEVRHEKENKKKQSVIRKELKFTDHGLAIFRAIREACSGKDKEVTTTTLSTKLKTGWPTISKGIESLKKLGLVKVEDDSPDDDNPLWYISLTRDGIAAVLPKAEVVTGTESAKKKTATLPADRPGPRSSKVGKKIYKLVDANPRREGTHGYNSFAIIKNGMTYEDYIKAGGRNNDLAWDVDHKYVELK